MFDPFELHPDDKKKISNGKKAKKVKVDKVCEILKKKLKEIKKNKTPMWGYKTEDVSYFFDDVIREIEKIAGEKDDS